jgi:hypothetical protein
MDGWGFFNGGAPVIHLGASLIRAIAGLSMAIFLYAFYKKQAWFGDPDKGWITLHGRLLGHFT